MTCRRLVLERTTLAAAERAAARHTEMASDLPEPQNISRFSSADQPAGTTDDGCGVGMNTDRGWTGFDGGSSGGYDRS